MLPPLYNILRLKLKSKMYFHLTIPVLLQSLFLLSTNGCNRRIVRDEESISWKGTHVDTKFQNEKPVPGRHTSSPGCPWSMDGYPWLLYGSPPRCYLAGYKGPCGEYMKLFIVPGQDYGICDCECFDPADEPTSMDHCQIGNSESGLNFHVARTTHGRYCTPLFQQNDCKTNEWTMLQPVGVGTGAPIMTTCAQRQCPPSEVGSLRHFSFFDNVTNTCEQNGAKCGPGAMKIYQVDKSNWIPVCRDLTPIEVIQKTHTRFIGSRCRTGYLFSDHLQKCVKTFTSVATGSIG